MNTDKIRQLYLNNDGTYNMEKLFNDLAIWLDFEEEYQITKLGGMMRFRDILGSPEEFIQKYSSGEKWWL